jgi:excisionase family DNA binding protein
MAKQKLVRQPHPAQPTLQWSNHMPDTLLTTKQVAQYLKIDKFTVYRLVAQRKLPAYKVGSQWRFNKKLIDKWLRQNLNIPVTTKTQ